MNPTLEQTTMRKVYLRLLPLAMVVYFFCYLDRINVSFAALQMNADIGLTAAAYGLSSTAFYLGYCLFEVPSNVILDKVGARIWIARIMITWGLVSAATAFATDPVDHDRRCCLASRVVVLRPVVRPERRLERRKQTHDIGPVEVRVRSAKVLARHAVAYEEIRRLGQLGLKPVDSGACGTEFAPDFRNVLMPVKSTVRHVRQSSREPG